MKCGQPNNHLHCHAFHTNNDIYERYVGLGKATEGLNGPLETIAIIRRNRLPSATKSLPSAGDSSISIHDSATVPGPTGVLKQNWRVQKKVN